MKNHARSREVYGPQIRNTEAEGACVVICMRAERKVDELLRETRQSGEREKPSGNRTGRSKSQAI